MIEPSDRIELAPGVLLRGGALHDSVRRVDVPLNATASLAFRPGATIAEMATALERLGARDAERDALSFATQLNRRLLANVRTPRRDLLRRRARALRYGIPPRAPVRRVAVEDARTFVVALAPSASAVIVALLPLAALAGVWTIAAAAAAGIGVVVHEAAHALALLGVPRALVLDGLRPSILHPPVSAPRTFAVATAGPLAPALLGLGVALGWPAAAPAVVPLAAHVLGLSVLAPDGRAACGLS